MGLIMIRSGKKPRVPRALHCYAAGRQGDWEAICLDLDIAVQGRSFDEVFHALAGAVGLYLESVDDLPQTERAHLSKRRAPLHVRLKFAGHALAALVRGDEEGTYYHQYTMPLAA